MISGLSAYPATKNSGVPWLGKVPDHWEVLKLRQILERVTERNRTDLPLLSVVREKGVILRDTSISGSAENHNFIPDDLSNYKVVRRGQFAMNKMKAWQGSYGVSKYDGIVSPAYLVFNVRSIESQYFHAAIRSQAYVPSFTQASDGVRIGQWDLAEARMREISFLVPPPPEQASIVRFLDHVDRRIQRYIRAKQKLIKLLEEQKQAIIQRAVTRGLNPHADLKPSGVDWFGTVPEHWDVIPFKRRVKFQEGPGIMAADFRDSGTPLLRIACLLSTDDPLAGCNFLDPNRVDSRWRHFLVRNGDFILNASTSATTVLIKRACGAWVGCVPYTGLIRLWSLDPEVSMEYVSVLIQSQAVQGQLLMSRTGVGVAHFGPSHLNRLWIVLPPVSEQIEIVRFVQDVTADIEAAIEAMRREIAVVKEHRARLTADVVTGKLDVRQAAARLFDGGEQDAPPDEGEAENAAEEADNDETGADEIMS